MMKITPAGLRIFTAFGTGLGKSGCIANYWNFKTQIIFYGISGLAQGRRTRLSSSAYKQARIVQRVSLPGLGLARGCGVGWGGVGGKNTVEPRAWEEVWVGGESWVQAGAARGSSLPAGRGRPRGSPAAPSLEGSRATSPVAWEDPGRRKASGKPASRNGHRPAGSRRLPH